MRVLYLTDSLSDIDGIGRYAVRLIAGLEAVEPELEVEVLLARKHRPTSPLVPPTWNVRVGLPPDYFMYMSPARYWTDLLRCLPGVVRAARRADLVHAIKDFPHSYLALLGAKLAGKPCIATGHGTYTVAPLQSKRHRRAALWSYRRFARIVSVSRYTKGRVLEELGGRPPGPERIAVVPNAVEADHFAAPRAVGDRPWQHVPFTLSIGEVKERKGHHLSLGAWCAVAPEHPELHHFIVGNRAGDDYERGLHERVAAAGLTERVHFLGNVDEDEKVDLLQRARAFLHTPVTAADGGFEGFGIVYLEAAAAGTVSIGTLGCGAEDAIRDGETGFLVRQEEAAVADALRKLLGDEAETERMAAAAVEHARANTWEDNAREVLRIYREVLGGVEPGAATQDGRG